MQPQRFAMVGGCLQSFAVVESVAKRRRIQVEQLRRNCCLEQGLSRPSTQSPLTARLAMVRRCLNQSQTIANHRKQPPTFSSRYRFRADVTALALQAVVTQIKLIEEVHETADDDGLIGHDTGFKVAALIALRADAGTGKIG